MLADGCEARARAELPRTDVELRSLVKKVFDYLQQEGQLDQTSLTLNDLNVAAESFTNTLRNSYHPRIVYPEIKSPLNPTEPILFVTNQEEITKLKVNKNDPCHPKFACTQRPFSGPHSSYRRVKRLKQWEQREMHRSFLPVTMRSNR